MNTEQPLTFELFDPLTSTVIKTGDFLDLAAAMEKGYVIRTETTKDVVAFTRNIDSHVVICTVEPWISLEFVRERLMTDSIRTLSKNPAPYLPYLPEQFLTPTETVKDSNEYRCPRCYPDSCLNRD